MPVLECPENVWMAIYLKRELGDSMTILTRQINFSNRETERPVVRPIAFYALFSTSIDRHIHLDTTIETDARRMSVALESVSVQAMCCSSAVGNAADRTDR